MFDQRVGVIRDRRRRLVSGADVGHADDAGQDHGDDGGRQQLPDEGVGDLSREPAAIATTGADSSCPMKGISESAPAITPPAIAATTATAMTTGLLIVWFIESLSVSVAAPMGRKTY